MLMIVSLQEIEAHFEVDDKCQMEITINGALTFEHFIIRAHRLHEGRVQYQLKYTSGQPYGSTWYPEDQLEDE